MSKKIIYLDDAIDAIRALWDGAPTAQHVSAMFDCEDALQALPSAQPEITDEQAILHLHSTGWMQNHDREMYEGELRKQLEYNSEGCDSLIPCKDIISRQAAIDALSHMCSEDENGITVSRTNVNSMLRVLPSEQPEIIRCKDCKYCEHWYADRGRCFLWAETGIAVF